MSEDQYPHCFCASDEEVKMLARAAAILGLEDEPEALTLGLHLVTRYAEAYARGKTETVSCTSQLAASIENNPAFFEALCQEGVIEWLTPFVLGKSTIPPEEN